MAGEEFTALGQALNPRNLNATMQMIRRSQAETTARANHAEAINEFNQRLQTNKEFASDAKALMKFHPNAESDPQRFVEYTASAEAHHMNRNTVNEMIEKGLLEEGDVKGLMSDSLLEPERVSAKLSNLALAFAAKQREDDRVNSISGAARNAVAAAQTGGLAAGYEAIKSAGLDAKDTTRAQDAFMSEMSARGRLAAPGVEAAKDAQKVADKEAMSSLMLQANALEYEDGKAMIMGSDLSSTLKAEALSALAIQKGKAKGLAAGVQGEALDALRDNTLTSMDQVDPLIDSLITSGQLKSVAQINEATEKARKTVTANMAQARADGAGKAKGAKGLLTKAQRDIARLPRQLRVKKMADIRGEMSDAAYAEFLATADSSDRLGPVLMDRIKKLGIEEANLGLASVKIVNDINAARGITGASVENMADVGKEEWVEYFESEAAASIFDKYGFKTVGEFKKTMDMYAAKMRSESSQVQKARVGSMKFLREFSEIGGKVKEGNNSFLEVTDDAHGLKFTDLDKPVGSSLSKLEIPGFTGRRMVKAWFGDTPIIAQVAQLEDGTARAYVYDANLGKAVPHTMTLDPASGSPVIGDPVPQSDSANMAIDKIFEMKDKKEWAKPNVEVYNRISALRAKIRREYKTQLEKEGRPSRPFAATPLALGTLAVTGDPEAAAGVFGAAISGSEDEALNTPMSRLLRKVEAARAVAKSLAFEDGILGAMQFPWGGTKPGTPSDVVAAGNTLVTYDELLAEFNDIRSNVPTKE